MELLVAEQLPCLVHEDDDLLVINKPAGICTHAPSSYAAQGIYEFLRGRELRWADLAIMHRLDKETSGLLVFSKSTAASRSLTRQFTERQVRKVYLLETDHPASFQAKEVTSGLVRAGDRYVSRPAHAGAEMATTRFSLLRPTDRGTFLWHAEPLTGKTHQIRVHAAFLGIPIRGDSLYGGTPAPRVCLHAMEIGFRDLSGKPISFRVETEFADDARQSIRTNLIDFSLTTAYRMIHGSADGWAGWSVDRFGDYLLSQSEVALRSDQESCLRGLAAGTRARGAFHKILSKSVSGAPLAEVSPHLVFGEAAPEHFDVSENGIKYLLSFGEGYSPGLFLDQRENRRRWLLRDQRGVFPTPGMSSKLPGSGPGNERAVSVEKNSGLPEVLNAFAYTCGFSVCAARGGARVTSLDLSRKYLDWGRRNFLANGIDPAKHDFIFGDVFEWCKRLERKGRSFDAIILDPPTFSRSKSHGTFRAEKDYPQLVAAALRLLKSNGLMFASSNAAQWRAEDFAASLKKAVTSCGRSIASFDYAAQPLDFPIHPREPTHLKTAWIKIV